jgi:hypothetical protein
MVTTSKYATFKEGSSILTSKSLLHQEVMALFFDQFEVFDILKQLLPRVFLFVPFNNVVCGSFVLQPLQNSFILVYNFFVFTHPLVVVQ